MFWNKYPYTDFHELNLDMILDLMKKLHAEWDEFTAVNKITNAGAWDITKQYQAWTVVSDNNIGYISLKPVPAGIAITNIEYWGVIADYNILITDLSNRISILENEVSTLNTTVSLLTTKKVVFLGDSYQFVGNGWVDGVAAGIGVAVNNYYNYCVSGHGFTVPGGKWVDDLASFVTDHPDEVNNITDIIIVGGINDAGGSNLSDEIDTFFGYVRANIPNARVTMGFVGNAAESSLILAGRTSEKRLECMGVERVAFAKNNGIYLSGTENILYQYTLIGSDLLHPSTFGVDAIITGVVQAINSGNCDVIAYKRVTGSATSDYAETYNNGDYTLDIKMMYIPDGTVISSTPVEIGQNLAYSNYISANTTEKTLGYLENRSYTDNTLVPVYVFLENHKIMAAAAFAATSGSYPSVTVGSMCYLTNTKLHTIGQNIL